MPSRGIAIWRLVVRVEKRRIDGNVSKKNRILMNGALNPKSDTNRTYLPRQKVG